MSPSSSAYIIYLLRVEIRKVLPRILGQRVEEGFVGTAGLGKRPSHVRELLRVAVLGALRQLRRQRVQQRRQLRAPAALGDAVGNVGELPGSDLLASSDDLDGVDGEGGEGLRMLLELVPVSSHPKPAQAAPGSREVNVIYPALLLGARLQQPVDRRCALDPSREQLGARLLASSGNVLRVLDGSAGLAIAKAAARGAAGAAPSTVIATTPAPAAPVIRTAAVVRTSAPATAPAR